MAASTSEQEDQAIPPSNYEKFLDQGSYEFNADRQCVFALTYTPDGKHLLVAYGDGSVEVLSVTEGKPKLYKTPMKKKYGELPFMCLRNHPIEKDVFFAGSARGAMFSCRVHDDDKDSIKEVFTEKKNEIHTFDFGVDGSEFATGGKDLAVRLYDTETCQLIRTWAGYDVKKNHQATRVHGQRIFCLKFLRDQKSFESMNVNNTFITGGWDNHIKIWDSRLKDAVVKTISGPHICGDSIDFWRHKILVGSWKQHDSLEVFDLRYNKKIGESLPFHVAHQEEEGHEDKGEYLYCARFYDADTIVAGGSGTQSVQAVSMGHHKVIEEMKLDAKAPIFANKEKNVLALDTNPQGSQFAFGGNSDHIHIVSLT